MRTVTILFSMATLLACAVAGGEGSAQGPPGELRFELVARPSYLVGEPVVVTFRLFGQKQSALRVLRWNTPLEGVRARLFRVRRGEVDIPYKGRMYKRGDPAREDYLDLPAGGELSAEIDLSAYYDLSKVGDYRVEYAGSLLDVVPAGSDVPRPRSDFRGAALRSKPITLHIVARG
jgi:peptidyl-Lys metalloendopeptidase